MRNAIVALVLKFRALSKMQRGLLLGLAAVLCFLLLGQAGGPHVKRPSPPIAEFQQTENWPGAPSASPDSLGDDEKQKDLREAQRESAVSRVELGNRLASAAMPYATPLMAHTAELALATHEFAKSRTSLEEILERHRGYAAKLRMAGRRSGSVLSATLRVPSAELGRRRDYSATSGPGSAAGQCARHAATFAGVVKETDLPRRKRARTAATDRQRQRRGESFGSRAERFGTSRDFCQRAVFLAGSGNRSAGIAWRAVACSCSRGIWRSLREFVRDSAVLDWARADRFLVDGYSVRAGAICLAAVAGERGSGAGRAGLRGFKN